MATVYKWQLWCNDCNEWRYQWAEDQPTLCPVNTAHTLEPSKTSVVSKLGGPPTTDEGVAYVSILPGKSERKMTVVGLKFDAVAGQPTDEDKAWEETREIQGAWLEVVNQEPGDKVEFYVTMPDGTPIGQFGEDVFIPPSGKVDQIVSEGTVSFPPGFKVRLRYVAVAGGDTRTVYAWLRMRK